MTTSSTATLVTGLPCWLLQRLVDKHRPEPDPSRGFDGYFGLDYMGSSEYEWGAPAESLARINETPERRVGITTMTLTARDKVRTVYLVGDQRRTTAYGDRLVAWLNGDTRSKEVSYLPEAWDTLTLPEYSRDVVAWWDLRDDVLIALNAATADDLLSALKASRAKRASAASR